MDLFQSKIWTSPLLSAAAGKVFRMYLSSILSHARSSVPLGCVCLFLCVSVCCDIFSGETAACQGMVESLALRLIRRSIGADRPLIADSNGHTLGAYRKYQDTLVQQQHGEMKNKGCV